MFFASTYESATPYFNPLQILNLENLFKLKVSILVFKINASKETSSRLFKTQFVQQLLSTQG